MQVVTLKMSSGHLLVPVSIVAQIIGSSGLSAYDGRLPSVRNAITWRDYRIPLVFSSELCGAPEGSDEDFERSVVLWPMKGAGATDMIALSSQNSPRVVNITPDSGMGDQAVYGDFSLGTVSVEGGLGIIPDLEKLSNTIYG